MLPIFERLFRKPSGPKSLREGYHVFTTKYDLEVDANKLGLHSGTGGMLGNVALRNAANDFDSQLPAWRIKADIAAIEAVDRIHSVLGSAQLKDTVICLLIDHSGSMRGQRALLALTLTTVVSDLWSRLGVAYEILGFTTRSWRGGNSRRAWKWAGRPRNPGRLCDLLHIVYRSAHDTVPGVPWSIRNLLRDDLLKENVDGEAVEWASKRLRARPEGRKILIVVSDGAPVDDSTLTENSSDFLDRHIREVISTLKEAGDIQTAAIGIDHNVQRYYPLCIVVAGPDGLAKAVVPFIERIILPSTLGVPADGQV